MNFGDTNSMSKKWFGIISIFVLLLGGFFLLIPNTTLYAETCPEGTYCLLAPLGNNISTVDASFGLDNYILSFFKIGIAVAGVLAVVMFVIGGITYMISDVVGEKESAKGMMTNAVFGLLLALGAFAILNTINPTILSLNFVGGGSSQSGGGGNNGNNNGGGMSDTDSIGNSCQDETRACSNSECGQYATAISNVAGSGTDMEKILKAVMVVESSCNVYAESESDACGLFQLLPATADSNKAGCTNDTITCDWLRSPANAQESACIAKNFLNNLYNNSNSGGDWENVFAGYNGGATAMEPSADCANNVSCLNGTTPKKWECLWDNPEHTEPNEGEGSYEETRNYVPQVNYCYHNPGF